MSDTVVVPFGIDADDVNLLDGTPYELGTAGADSDVVLVPVRLEIWREAGTAYTVTHATSVPAPAETIYPKDAKTAAPIWAAPEFVVYALNTRFFADRTDREGPLFRVPMYDFINCADAAGFVVLPEGGIALRPGDLTLYIEALAAISGGTGAISGRVVFERFHLVRGVHGR